MRKIALKPPWVKMTTAWQHIQSDSMSSHDKAETRKGVGGYSSRLPQILSRFQKKRVGPYQNRSPGNETTLSTPQEHPRKNQQKINKYHV